MSKKYGTFTTELLMAVGQMTGLFSWPPEGSQEWIRRELWRNRRTAYHSLYKLEKSGYIKKMSKAGKIFLSLTAKGQLELLIRKARTVKRGVWDGCWRLAIFDIPEDGHWQRDKLRRLLRQNGFIKLQASVYVSPYALNREALEYLKQSRLIGFIRLMRVSEIDDDRIIKKKFGLK